MVVRFSENLPERHSKKHEHDNVQWHEFLSLESPHPYGVLPVGNRFLVEESLAENQKIKNPNDDPRTCCLRQLNDETWLQIFGFCDGMTLASVVQTCRFFYVAGHQPELWRDLVLRLLDCRKKLKNNNNDSSIIIDRVGDSWKDTYVLLSLGKQQLECPSKPMKVPGIYSDDLYRLHSCRAFAIPRSWLQPPTIRSENNNNNNNQQGLVQHVKAQDLNCHEFVTRFEKPNLPVVIQAAAKHWKAFCDWQDPAYLRCHTEGRTFRATSGAAPLPANFTLEAFQKYLSHPNLEEAPLYLFDREALKPNSHLHQDYYPDLQKSCPYFDPSNSCDNNNNDDDEYEKAGHDLLQVLGEGKRPDHTWAIIGGNHSGSVFHIDPNATHAWNAAIVGRKRWIFYPPGVTPPGVHPSQDGDEVALPLSIGEWILTFWKEHCERKAKAPIHERPLECTAFPGDVVFVPHGWWHMVINLDKVNIAITHNYVSRSNLGNVLRFFKRKEDQISGCRDRVESIKPDKLHSAFITALQDRFGKDAEWLVQAQQQADSHWTCNAWNDDRDDHHENTSANCRLPKKRRLKHGLDEKTTHATSIMLKAKASNTDSTANEPFSFSFM